MNSDAEIIAGIARVEAFNDQFRQPNPNGNYPVCKPICGDKERHCERCGRIILDYSPCPAVPPAERWGQNWSPVKESEAACD